MTPQPTDKSGISLGRVTTLLLLSRVVVYGLALVNSVIIARALGLERLGAYAYAMGVAAVFGLLPNMGISTVVTRTVARSPENARATLRTALAAQVLLSSGTLVVIPAVAALLPGQPVPLSYVLLAAAQLTVGTLSWPYLAIVSGRARFDRLAATELIAAAAGTISLIVAATLYESVVAVLTAHLVASAIVVLLARRVALSLLPHDSGEPTSIREVFRQAGPFGATAAIESLYTRIDIILLGQLSTRGVLGLYSVAYKPTTLAIYFGSTIAGALFPLMAREPASGTAHSFRRAMRGVGAMAPAMALFISGLASPLLWLLYGDEFAAAAPILVVLAWSAAIHWLYAPLGVALQARGRERGWLAAMATALLINVAGNLWAIPRWGAMGAAGATLVSELILLGCGAVLAARHLNFLPPLRPVLVGLGATAVGIGILWGLVPVDAALATTLAILAYGSLLMVFRIVTTEDAAAVIGWFRQAHLGVARGQ